MADSSLSVDSSQSVFDRVRDVIAAWRKELPDKLKNDDDIGKILLRIDKLQIAHEAILTDARNVTLMVQHVCQDMVYLVDDLEDAYGGILPRSTERRLREMASRVLSAENESAKFERRFETLCLDIVSDLCEIENLNSKFQAKIKTRKLQKDIGTGVAILGLALFVCLPVIGVGVAALAADAVAATAATGIGLIAGTVSGGVGICGASLAFLSSLDLTKLGDKERLLSDVSHHLEMRRRSGESMQTWWGTVKTDIGDLSLEPAQVSRYSLEQLQQMRAVWDAMRQHVAVPPLSIGNPFTSQEMVTAATIETIAL